MSTTSSSATQFIHKVLKSIDDKDQVESIVKIDPEAINQKDEHGDSLLHFASRSHNVPIMALLIDNGADPEAVNEHGRRPIHEAIDSVECVTFLVQHCHVDVNALKRGDWTPVMIAAMKGNLEVVKILVKAGALLNRTTKDGRTALYLAVQEGNVQVTKYLTDQYQEAIAQATKSGRLPTQAAAAYHEPQAAYDMTTYLLSHTRSRGILEHCDNSGRNLMVDATLAQNLDLLSYLVLDQGVDMNDRDTLGRNMIHHAAMMGHLKVLELFLKLDQGKTVEWDGVDSWDHWTPLMHAARQGHLNVVQFLIETIHANKSIRDKQGRTAKDIAVLWKHDSVADYLL